MHFSKPSNCLLGFFFFEFYVYLSQTDDICWEQDSKCSLKNPFKGGYPIFYCHIPDYFLCHGLFQQSLAPRHSWVSFPASFRLFYSSAMLPQCCIPLCLKHSENLVHFTESTKNAHIKQLAVYW